MTLIVGFELMLGRPPTKLEVKDCSSRAQSDRMTLDSGLEKRTVHKVKGIAVDSAPVHIVVKVAR